MSVAHVPQAGGPDGGAGLDLYYELHGLDDGAPVLNIGGSGGDLRRTFPGLLPLNKHFQVLSYDQRGLGQSGRPDSEFTMAHYADDAAALIEHIGWERCHVMGTSFGGMVALNLAIRHPHLVDRMVLSCTSPGGTHPSYPLQELGLMDSDEAFVTRMRINDTRWDPEADEPTPGMGAYYDTMVAQARATPDPDVLAGVVKQIAARAGHDVEADLTSIGHETLICAGRFDGTAPLPNSELLAATMPDARLAVFEGGHLFFLQDRSAYASMTEFLQHGHTGPPE
jgi:3-oxoadipate enol-lactonase